MEVVAEEVVVGQIAVPFRRGKTYEWNPVPWMTGGSKPPANQPRSIGTNPPSKWWIARAGFPSMRNFPWSPSGVSGDTRTVEFRVRELGEHEAQDQLLRLADFHPRPSAEASIVPTTCRAAG